MYQIFFVHVYIKCSGSITDLSVEVLVSSVVGPVVVCDGSPSCPQMLVYVVVQLVEDFESESTTRALAIPARVSHPPSFLPLKASKYCLQVLHSMYCTLAYMYIIRKNGSLYTNFNSERNFADISTRYSSLLQGENIYP